MLPLCSLSPSFWRVAGTLTVTDKWWAGTLPDGNRQPRPQKKILRLPEILASFGIMGAQLRAFIKPPYTIVLGCTRSYKEALNWAPMMPRDARLLDSCTPVLFSLFSRPVMLHVFPNKALFRRRKQASKLPRTSQSRCQHISNTFSMSKIPGFLTLGGFIWTSQCL